MIVLLRVLVCIHLILCFSNCKRKFTSEKQEKESFNYFKFKNLIEEFPFQSNPATNFLNEYVSFKNSTSYKITKRNLPQWKSLGPFNLAGRSLCLAINPKDTSEIWMGSAGSGLWKSEKGGVGENSWKYITTGYPVLGVASIAIQQDQPEVIYIGTGEVYNADGSDGGIHTRTLRGSWGIGILKSTDGGLHWNLILDWSQKPNTAIWKIIIHPENPQILLAATNIGIYKSLDGGNRWNQVLDIPLALDLIIDHRNPSVLYAGIGGINGSNYGIYKSYDEGQNWIRLSIPNDTLYQGRIMLANYKSNPNRVYAGFSDKFKTIGFMRSRQGFENSNFYLQAKDITEHQGWYAKCLHVKDDDSSKIIMGGVDLYLDSSGTGNQFFNLSAWKIKVHADMHDIISNPKDPNKIYIATDGGLYRSNDFAQTFTACNHGFLSTQFYTGNVTKHSSQLLGGLQDNRSVLYNKYGNWKNIHQGDGTFNAFHPSYDSILYVASQFANLCVSYDEGIEWDEILKPNFNASFVSPFIVNPKNQAHIICGSTSLLYSFDTGKSWDSTFLFTQGESIVALEMDPNVDLTLYISSLNVLTRQSHLYKSQDGGKTISLIDADIPERFIRDIAISNPDSKIMYLALGGNGQAGIMQSVDGGRSWKFTDNTGLPNVPYHTILVDPYDQDILYAGCDFGLYTSLDKGRTWMAINQHPYDLVPIYDVKYSPWENKLILYTHGFGAFSCELLSKEVISNTAKAHYKNRFIFSQGNDCIILQQENLMITKLLLYNSAGKIFSLYKSGNEFSTRLIPNGLYYIITPAPGNSCEKILIMR